MRVVIFLVCKRLRHELALENEIMSDHVLLVTPALRPRNRPCLTLSRVDGAGDAPHAPSETRLILYSEGHGWFEGG